jgi:hypothetical protein
MKSSRMFLGRNDEGSIKIVYSFRTPLEHRHFARKNEYIKKQLFGPQRIPLSTFMEQAGGDRF